MYVCSHFTDRPAEDVSAKLGGQLLLGDPYISSHFCRSEVKVTGSEGQYFNFVLYEIYYEAKLAKFLLQVKGQVRIVRMGKNLCTRVPSNLFSLLLESRLTS